MRNDMANRKHALWETLLFVTILTLGLTVGVLYSTGWPSPFLVSAPQQNVTHYNIEREVKDMTGNVTVITEKSDAQPVAEGVRLHYDMYGLPIGVHTMRVYAVRIENRTGGATYAISDPAPFVYESASSPPPSGLTLSME